MFENVIFYDLANAKLINTVQRKKVKNMKLYIWILDSDQLVAAFAPDIRKARALIRKEFDAQNTVEGPAILRVNVDASKYTNTSAFTVNMGA